MEDQAQEPVKNGRNPFFKGNPILQEWQAQSVQVRKENRQKLWDFVASGGAKEYLGKLADLAEGKELTKPEQEFMDRIEKLFPYTKSKPAQGLEVTGSEGGPVQHKITVELVTAKHGQHPDT